MEKKQILQKLLFKYLDLSETLIQKDILMDDLLQYFSKIIEEFIKQNSREFEWSLVGGTMLSKCFHNTYRLSEDIDITFFCSSKASSKNIMKDFLMFFKKKLYDDKLIDFNDSNISSKGLMRSYFNMQFTYKGYSYDFDLKSVIKNQKLKFEKKSILNIISKNTESELSFSINTVELEYLIAEKMIAFERMSFDNIDDVRRTRHIYDIYSIFTNNLLSNNQDTWKRIKDFFNWILKNIQHNKDKIKPFNENIIFDTKKMSSEEIKTNIDELIKRECYKEEKVRKIITWFNDLKILIDCI